MQRAITIRTALGHGAVSRVAGGTGYSVQHVSRILSGHRPQPFVVAWALGLAGLPFDAAVLPAKPPAGFAAAVRKAHRAGGRAEGIDGPGLWETWKAAAALWPAGAEPGNTTPHQARRHLMGLGGGSGTVAGARPPQDTARRARTQATARHQTRGG